MATIEGNPGILQFLHWKAGKVLEKKQVNQAIRARTLFETIVRLTLTVAGFGFLTMGMFSWHIVAGYVCAGISCLVLSWLTKPEPPTNGPDALGYQR